MTNKISSVKRKARNGDGSIYERSRKGGSKYWVVEMSLGNRANGKRRRTRRNCNTFKEAKQLLTKLRGEQTAGTLSKFAMKLWQLLVLGRLAK